MDSYHILSGFISKIPAVETSLALRSRRADSLIQSGFEGFGNLLVGRRANHVAGRYHVPRTSHKPQSSDRVSMAAGAIWYRYDRTPEGVLAFELRQESLRESGLTVSQHQKALFDVEPAPWDLDDVEDQPVATVVFAEGAPGEFDYLIPKELEAEVCIGKRVRVPLGRGNRSVVGYCVRVESGKAQRRLKTVHGVLDRQSLITPKMLELTRWIADEYLCSWGRVLETVVPAAVRGQAGTYVATFLSVTTRVAARLTQLKLPPKQFEIVQYLASSPTPILQQTLLESIGCTSAPVKSLVSKGLVEAEKRRVSKRELDEAPGIVQPDIGMNADQQKAVDQVVRALREGRHENFVLYGVTGSGKTEVYIRVIQEVIGFGRQAIVLVPEISLTPQTVRRFRSRFQSVAVLHSHLTPSERNWHWQRIAQGNVQVVVGARSAVFAPTPNLGVIVLDEEHDSSFKQDTVPRYHARDVAIRRAETDQIPLLLGSATPSLASWQSASSGQATLVEMPNRVLDLPLPQVSTIDLRIEFENRFTRGAISRPLVHAMTDCLDAKGQVILLLNRRGFSTHIQCPACGEVVRCKECDIAMTHHKEQNQIVCHYCDYQTHAPPKCPSCGFEGIRYGGIGTQRLEAEVKSRFPDASCLRMDSDTMRKPGSHQEALGKFREGKVQILLGTQMIAKGLDFPNVTLVGVINADTGLHLPDFRAAERTFQLVTQVAGRTGRSDQGGRVLVQTFSPEHYAIECASQHDYRRFAEIETEIRRGLGYPPYGAMVRLIFRGESETRTNAFASEVVSEMETFLKEQQAEARLLGPTAAPIAKLRGRFRFHVLMQASEKSVLQSAVRHAESGIKPLEDVQWLADVDPLDML